MKDKNPFRKVPFDPFTGHDKPLNREVDLTRVPMMQVIEDDTHDNYVVCRGYDPDYEKFFTRLSVAKPYGQRGTTGIYNIGEVHPAVKAITMLGTTPGVASVTVGHPADLDERVDKLTDDEGIDIQWMLLTTEVGGTNSTVKIKPARDIDPYQPICYYNMNAEYAEEYRSTYYSVHGYYYDDYGVQYRVGVAPASGANADEITEFHTGNLPIRVKIADFAASLEDFEDYVEGNYDSSIQWGFVSEMSGMAPYLPGFYCLGDYDESTETAMFVVAGQPTFWGIVKTAYGVYQDNAIIQPARTVLRIYDGTGEFPDVRFLCSLQGDQNRITDHDVYTFNIGSGDMVQVWGWRYGYVTESVLDAPVGTVRMMTSNSNIPRGWAIMDGSANAAPTGSGINMSSKFVRGGGSSGSFGTTGTDYSFEGLYFIERLPINT